MFEFDNLENTLVRSLKCYEKAVELEPSKHDKDILVRRLGNIQNELGVLYMNQAGGKSSLEQLNTSRLVTRTVIQNCPRQFSFLLGKYENVAAFVQ